jgi:kynureninase
MSPEFAMCMDQEDPLREFRDRFEIPKDVIYLAGNCVGLQPRRAHRYIQDVLSGWANNGFRAYFTEPDPWLSYEDKYLTEPMAEVIGALPIETASMNGLTVNLHLMLISFYRPVAGREKILMEEDAFQSDRYAIDSQIRWHGRHALDVIVPASRSRDTGLLDVDQIVSLIEERGDEVALILLSNANFKSGQVLDMARITEAGHRKGCVVGFDLAHAVGNIELRLHEWGVDFAVWCNYKYMNGGPGCVGGCFVHERHADSPQSQRLQGWWGNRLSSRFNFTAGEGFEATPGARGWQLTTPPLLPMAVLRASLEIFAEAKMHRLRQKSIRLGNYMQLLLDEHLTDECQSLTPRNPDERGCQFTLKVRTDPKVLQTWLLERGVVCDAHGSDMIRIAPVPLYNSFTDVHRAVCLLQAYFDGRGGGAATQSAPATLAES